MLHFWYSERCTRQIKLIVCIATCVLIFIAAHLLYMMQLKMAQEHPYREGVARLAIFAPMIALIVLIGYLPEQDKVALALQCVGFAGVGLFLVSIQAQRVKRS